MKLTICLFLFIPIALSAQQLLIDGEELETLWEEGGFTEGAASGPDGSLYFSDFAQPFDSGPARVMKFDPNTKKISVHCPDSGMGNGLMFTRDGRLIGCTASPAGGHRALVEFKPDGKVEVIAGKFEGKRFNSPNDIVIDRKGRIYFTDPKYVGPEEMELDSFDVYRLDPDGSLKVATTAIDKPNGIILSPDQKTIYIAETDNGSAKADIEKNPTRGRMTLNAFPVDKTGDLGEKRVVADFGDQLGVDGMTMDTEGRIYAAVRSDPGFGIYIFSPEGKELGYIKTPILPTNCCFGRGDEINRLYITAGGGFYRIKTNATGYHPAID
ncbi:MAG: gluconolactonase [Verrucomicrobiales bacterium]